MDTDTQESYLELIIGPMFSGKTSYLINIYKKFVYCNIPVMVLNHSLDTRYSGEQLSNHDLHMIPCHFIASLQELWDNPSLQDIYQKSDVIIINEGQFFGDLEEKVKLLLTHKKKVFIAGLDSDFRQQKFGYMLDLIPICDNVIKLTSLCSFCKNGKKAIFSLRVSSDKEQTLIGSSNYAPVCRSCYINNSITMSKE